MKPQIFGKYCLLDRISVGGMAEVFRARPFNTRGYTGFLALKRILPHLAEDEDFVKMFSDEAIVTMRLRHPNVVRVYELASYEGASFILMEYIRGKDILAIQKAMRRRREVCPPVLAALVAQDIARGLHHAHNATDDEGRSLQIVHRDVSPQNILIQYDGLSKVIDFGIVKTEVQSTKTRVGVVKGKVGYMSPEQVRSEPLNGQSDLFSLGTVLWELSTNKRLFKGGNEFDTMNLVREAPIVPPSTLNPNVPPELDRIILKALERPLDRRYATCLEFAEDLNAFLASIPNIRENLASWMQQVFESDIIDELERIEKMKWIQMPSDVYNFYRQLEESDPAAAHDHNRSNTGLRLSDSQLRAVPPATVDTDDLVFADEKTQIRAGKFSLEDLEREINEAQESTQTGTNDPFGPSFSQEQSLRVQKTAESQSAEISFAQSTTRGLPSLKSLIIGLLLLLVIGVGGAVGAAALFDATPFEEATPELPQLTSFNLDVTPTSDIEVSIDDQIHGNSSPLSITSLSPGSHTLKIRGRGYRTYRDTIEIPQEGTLDHQVTLEKATDEKSSVLVDIGKLGSSARLFIDGKDTSLLKASEGVVLDPGKHLIEVVENGKAATSEIVDLEPASTITVTPPRLSKTTRTITFPEGLHVIINGKAIKGNQAEVNVTKLQKFVLEKGGQVVWSGMVGFPELGRSEFQPDIVPQGLKPSNFGQLAVQTGADWWSIHLGQDSTGFTSPIEVSSPIPVRAGTYDLILNRANASIKFKVRIGASGTTLFDRQVVFESEFTKPEPKAP